MIKIDGCDKAILGQTESCIYIYLYDLLIEIFCDEGMSKNEAIEWIDYNILRSTPYLGKNGPIIVQMY